MEQFKDPTRTPATYQNLRTISACCGSFVIAIGLMVLLGWIFNNEFLKSIRIGSVPTNPVAAIGFICTGSALLMLQEGYSKRKKKVATYLIIFTAVLAGLKLFSVITNIPIPFDHILFHGKLWYPARHELDSMAPNSAINFLLTTTALLLIDYATENGRRPSQYIGIIITLYALVTLYGYIYDISSLYTITSYIPMPLPAAISFFLLGTGILFSRPDKGPMSIVIGENSGQIIFMRFLALLLPLIFGWVRLHGEKAGYFNAELGTALFAVLTYAIAMFFLGRQSYLQYQIRKTKQQAINAIKENERRLQAILDNSATNISLKSVLGKYTLVNQQFKKDFNLEEENVLGKTDYDLFPREMARELNQYDHQIIKTGQPKSFEEKYPQKNGIHTYITVKFPLFTQDQKIYAIGAVSTDITQRKKLEEELQKSEERYSLALSGTNDGLWDWDIKNNYLFLSARWKSMLGYEEEEIPNTIDAWENQLHPDDREKTLAIIQEYFDKKVPVYAIEFRMRHKDGSYRWMLDRGMALWDEAGKPYRMIGYQTDLTDRKRLEAELRKSHQRLFSILDNIGEGVIVADKDGNFIIFNKRAEEILGVGSISESWEEWTQTYGVFLPDCVTHFPESEMPLYRALHGESAETWRCILKMKNFLLAAGSQLPAAPF